MPHTVGKRIAHIVAHSCLEVAKPVHVVVRICPGLAQCALVVDAQTATV